MAKECNNLLYDYTSIGADAREKEMRGKLVSYSSDAFFLRGKWMSSSERQRERESERVQ